MYNGFNEELMTTQDVDLWVRISNSFKFIYLDLPLVTHRVHRQMDSVNKTQLWLKECNDLYKKLALEFTIKDFSDISDLTLIDHYKYIVRAFRRRGFNLAATSIESTLGKYHFYFTLRMFNSFVNMLFKFARFIRRGCQKIWIKLR